MANKAKFSQLQWGLGLVAEELAQKPGEPGETLHWLQWGLGLVAEELNGTKTLPAYSFELQWGLGLVAEEFLRFLPSGLRFQVASMGPRPGSRGVCTGGAPGIGRVLLQWGLGLVAEEFTE